MFSPAAPAAQDGRDRGIASSFRECTAMTAMTTARATHTQPSAASLLLVKQIWFGKMEVD